MHTNGREQVRDMHEAESHLSEVVTQALDSIPDTTDIARTVVKQKDIIGGATCRTANRSNATGSAAALRETTV